jgi:hypothetical protein
VPRLEQSSDNPSDRLDALLAWTLDHHRCTGAFVIPGIDATAGALWLGTNMMSWVEARTERGGFCLGAVGAEALSTQAFEQLKEALELTVRGL